jgi:integrase
MRIPSYRKHSSGQARVSINGRDYLLGPYNSQESKAKYKRLIGEWIASGESCSFGIPPEQLTVSQLLLAYLNHVKNYYGTAPTSEYHRIKPALSAVRAAYGSHAAASFGPLQYKAVRETIAREGDRSRPYVNSLCERIKRMFRWAASEAMIPVANVQAINLVPPLKEGRTRLRETDPVLPVSDEIVEATLPHLSQVVADMVRFQRLTGCRPGEVCAIQPAMVDRSTEVWEIRLRKHKTSHRGKSRVIYVSKPAQAILSRYLLRPATAFCFSPKDTTKQFLRDRSENRITPLSCGNRAGKNRKSKPKRVPGHSYTTGSYGRAIARACERAFPPPSELKSSEQIRSWHREHTWSPNQLRHSFATRVRKEHGLEVASILLGHADVGVTQVYAEKDAQKAVAAIEAMGARSAHGASS